MTEAKNLILHMLDLVFSWLISVIILNVRISLPVSKHTALLLTFFPFLVSDSTFFSPFIFMSLF